MCYCRGPAEIVRHSERKAMLKKNSDNDSKTDTVVIKKYANRRLYNTETSTYVTLDDLGEMVRADRDFSVFDAKSGEDLTHSVLTQIIVDQESRGQNMLPVPFLRQLIRFYDDSMSRLVPGYLQFSLEALAREQETFREKVSHAFTSPTAALDVYQDQVRRNIEIFEQAMAIWSPFGTTPQDSAAEGSPSGASEGAPESQSANPPTTNNELNELKAQMAAMQEKIEDLTRKDD